MLGKNTGKWRFSCVLWVLITVAPRNNTPDGNRRIVRTLKFSPKVLYNSVQSGAARFACASLFWRSPQGDRSGSNIVKASPICLSLPSELP